MKIYNPDDDGESDEAFERGEPMGFLPTMDIGYLYQDRGEKWPEEWISLGYVEDDDDIPESLRSA